jgi:DNA modification methylase
MNQVYRGDFMSNNLADKSVQLIIADPPYFEVKGDFDFAWSSFAEYQKDVEKWATECKRLLADNGTLFWWGHALKIAYSQVILDKYFSLVNSLVWEKKECQTMKNEPEAMRSFAAVTERLLMYGNEIPFLENRDLSDSAHLVYSKSTISYLKNELQKSGFSLPNLTKILNIGKHQLPHYFTFSGFRFPPLDIYEKLQRETGYFQKPYEALRTEYEALRTEYEALRRPFNQTKLQTDVLKYSQESHITKAYDHETKKPETLTRALILTCSRPNDLVFVPFAGSGTECAMAAKEGRNFVGYDINKKYVDMANNRTAKILSQPTLF